MINNKLIKVCGMRDPENIRQVESLGVDLMGFIFYPGSPRYVESLPEQMPAPHKRVGVFVNEKVEKIDHRAKQYQLNYIQLHGNESPVYCETLRKSSYRLIKAFSISEKADLTPINDYEGICDYFLFDTKCNGYGGSGERFDWEILSSYKGNTPFLLSGGIDIDSVPNILKFYHPKLAGYDLNSKFETEPGIKDIIQLEQFINKLTL